MIALETKLIENGYTSDFTSDRCSSINRINVIYSKKGKEDVIIGLNERGHAPTLKSHRHLIYEKQGDYYVMCNDDDAINRMLQNELDEVVNLICND